MAEFAIAVGLLEVVSVGISLTRTLHDLGTTAREAGEQTDLLAKNISHHCRALKDLSRQIKIQNPDHSEEALELAKDLQEQSDVVLKKIRRILPRPRHHDDGLSFQQRLTWALRKRRVAHLVGQLEYLKSTVTLLFHVLSTVPNLRKYRRSQEKSPELREEISEELTEAQNLLYERCRAQHNLPELAAEDAADDITDEIRTIEIVPDVRSSSPTPPYSIEDMAPHPGNCLAQIDAYANELMDNDSGALVWQKTTTWLAQLYGRWTTLPVDESVSHTGTPVEEKSSEFARFALSDIDDSHSANPEDFQVDERVSQIGERTEAAQSPPTMPVNEGEGLHLQGDISFSGGPAYGHIVAYLPLSNIITRLDAIIREIHHLKDQKPTSVVSHRHIHQRLCELEFCKTLLEAEHKVKELWPLQSAYLENVNNNIQKHRNELYATLRYEDWEYTNWFGNDDVFRLPGKLAWLRLVREEYKVKMSDSYLEIWPAIPIPFCSETTSNSQHDPVTATTTTLQDASLGQVAEEEVPDRDPPKLKSIREMPPSAPFRVHKQTSSEITWTKISRVLVNYEALVEAHERFEEHGDSFAVLRVLTREEIAKLAERTQQIRDARRSRSGRSRKSSFKQPRKTSPRPSTNTLDARNPLSQKQLRGTKGLLGPGAIASFLEALDGMKL